MIDDPEKKNPGIHPLRCHFSWPMHFRLGAKTFVYPDNSSQIGTTFFLHTVSYKNQTRLPTSPCTSHFSLLQLNYRELIN